MLVSLLYFIIYFVFVCVTGREGKLVLFCPRTPDLNGAVSVIYTVSFLGLFYVGVHVLCYTYFYIIVLMIVTDIEFHVMRITDGVDAPSVLMT
jgi:hypothetical protein